jgi:hypothetical protein
MRYTMKQIYVKLNELELDKCKIISLDWRVCKQAFPLKSTHLHQECEARLLEPTTAIPLDCNNKVVSLNPLQTGHPNWGSWLLNVADRALN